MCLRITNDKEDVNAEEIVYKFLQISHDGTLYSPAQNHGFFSDGKWSFIRVYNQYEWDKEGWNEVSISDINEDVSPNARGYHTYVDREIAIQAAKSWIEDWNEFNYVVVKLKVQHRIAQGTIEKCDEISDGEKGEVWRKAKILEIIPIEKEEDEDDE